MANTEIQRRDNEAFCCGMSYAGDQCHDRAYGRVLTADEAADLESEFQSNAPDLAEGFGYDSEEIYEGMLYTLQERQKRAKV